MEANGAYNLEDIHRNLDMMLPRKEQAHATGLRVWKESSE